MADPFDAIDDTIHTRLEVPASELGLPAPEHPVRGELRRNGAGWVMRLETRKGDAGALVAWAQSFGGAPLGPATGRSVRVELGKLPPALRRIAARFHVHEIALDAAGGASILLEGSRAALRAFVTETEARPVVRRVGPPTGIRRILTARQLEALSAAVAAGYYDVPRRVNLRLLAERMGISPASLSELLRRAEGQIVLAFMRGEPPFEDG